MLFYFKHELLSIEMLEPKGKLVKIGSCPFISIAIYFLYAKNALF